VLLTVNPPVFATGAGILVARLAAWTAVGPLRVSVSLLALGGAPGESPFPQAVASLTDRTRALSIGARRFG
jgi:hypothetical protein